jgi:hypothetical protein
MLTVMSRSRGASVFRTAASAAALMALLAGCTDKPAPVPSPTPTTAAPTTPDSTPTDTGTPAPSFTPPAPRGVTRPPGLGPVKGSTCDQAISDAHFYEVGWYSAYASYAEDGKPVPDIQWADGARVLPTFLSGVGTTRAALQAAGVPSSFIAYRDLAELDGAMRGGVTVAKARDETKLLAVYFAVRTAQAHLVESCGALE